MAHSSSISDTDESHQRIQNACQIVRTKPEILERLQFCEEDVKICRKIIGRHVENFAETLQTQKPEASGSFALIIPLRHSGDITQKGYEKKRTRLLQQYASKQLDEIDEIRAAKGELRPRKRAFHLRPETANCLRGAKNLLGLGNLRFLRGQRNFESGSVPRVEKLIGLL
ncbi:hypothetical protein EAI_05741 [Harpegnathos saltator]|uniref:DMAP1-binding domain-containing protein n=1 Tax=Harpegnathos saltator TaxID=610380 RepID=E2C063_HARSA|nr:hypothetical protein EAI_05741 [Harpegnathos saltator]